MAEDKYETYRVHVEFILYVEAASPEEALAEGKDWRPEDPTSPLGYGELTPSKVTISWVEELEGS